MKNLLLSIVEDELLRNFAAASSTFSIKTVRAVILAMVPLVEELITHEMKIAGYVALMHDAWTKYSTHYFGLFASYNVKVNQKVGGEVCELTMQKQVLLKASPLTTLATKENILIKQQNNQISRQR